MKNPKNRINPYAIGVWSSIVLSGLTIVSPRAWADDFNLSDTTLFPGSTIVDTRVDPKNVRVSLSTYVDYGALDSSNLYFPTDIDFDANGRGFVAQVDGRIRILDNSGLLQSTPFYVGEDVTDFARPFDRGMTSVALHPDFLNAGAAGYGKLYTIEASTDFDSRDADFTRPITGKNVDLGAHTNLLYEYTLANPLANTLDLRDAVLNPTGVDTRRIVLSALQRHHSHNFNDLAFDSSGILYLSSGDGGNGNDGTKVGWDKNASTLVDNPWGKIFRFDPLGIQGETETFTGGARFSVPTDNPMFDNADGVRIDDAVFAYGARNPYRISLDGATGELWSSSTGQNNVESIYKIGSGDDLGWGLLEGSFIYSGVSTQNIDPTSIAHALATGFANFIEGDPPTPTNRALTADELARLDNAALPVFEYDHTEGASVTGGLVYHGSMRPLEGMYVFADYQGLSDTETVDDEGRTIGDGARLFYGDPTTGEIFQFVIDGNGLDVPDRILGFVQTPAGVLLVYGFNFTETPGVFEGVVLEIGDANLAADFDNDGFVGQSDLALVLIHWGATVADGESPHEDWVNDRGITGTLIDADELELVLNHWGDTSAILDQLPAIAAGTGLSEDEIRGLIPEPGTIPTLAAGATLVLLRRRSA